MSIEVRALQRRFKNGRGLGPVNLRFEGGDCVGVMGPNGAGKTTLLRLLATADSPDSGVVSWHGMRSARSARRDIGFAADTVVEEGSLTARQATHFWCSQWTPRRDVAELVSAALDAFDVLDVADEPVATFSFGMRRRLGLAQALVHRPGIALLDEPTAGLDPDGVAALRRVIAARCGEGTTTVVASNDCAFVAAACTRVVFLEAGRVLRDATPEVLLAEVHGARTATLEVAESFDIAELRGIPGVGSVQREDGHVDVELLDASALSMVVAAADDGDGRLRGLRLRSPDLSDSFRHLTGHSLRSAVEEQVPS